MSKEKTTKEKSTNPRPWWQNGIRFECQGSGNCCLSRGEYGFVFLTREDRKRMADHLKLPLRDFTKKFCDKKNGVFHLKEDPQRLDCLFLKGKQCGIYAARPTQCRTWPFWPEVMNAKVWSREVQPFCPGVGKGRLYSAEEIEKNLNEQRRSESQLLKERR